MMEPLYSLGEMADRLAIYDLYARYVHQADAFDHQALDDVFDPDTVMDWTEAGYRTMSWAEAKQDPLMGGKLFSHAFHINTNFLIRFNEDRSTAEVVSKTINPIGAASPTGKPRAFQTHGGYVDQLVRYPDRWKIRHRRWKNAFIYSAGEVMSEMGEMLA